ncbi:transglutaminase domain-containing protein [uncultured Rikenella sp.]|uniref:transglutaminase domain-containing protein n=1 Tax=uncultured Rikenella sp. TaxID=368003 RepID=UPI00261EE5CC|nr:transglutaminase domain-containing protein [uncultured Rikenella sp.]
MKKTLFAAWALALLTACGGSGRLVEQAQTRQRVAERVAERADWLPELPAEATPKERDGMEFLYAYMPVGDATDYAPELYLANVRASLRAAEEMPWGRTVPNDLFLHYVLPVRINNENLDTSRVTFYDELKERVKGLSMEEAILEVNHWCHEKVIYTPSDGRTMSPSAAVRNAQGRCGEESTFTVAALRAVGIPARQVYTPRWAHTDDNHAWVEAWADGKWYYFGACEPEPVLDMGWFDGPSKRGMLMHTKVFGDYLGDEEVIGRTPLHTEINVTHNYAPVATATIVVRDTTGAAVPGASVDFGIYNYAEFYPAVRKKTDAEGKTTMTAGLGDMLVWATDGADFGYEKLSFGKQDTLVIVLNRRGGAGESYAAAFDIVPPAEGKTADRVTPEQRAANGLRLAQEDSIRNAYISGWMSKEDAFALAQRIGADTARVWNAISTSRGNWAEIAKFLSEAAKLGELVTAFDLLDVVSTKDLQDTPAAVLADHLTGAVAYKDRPYFKEYILNPRVGRELLVPYRSAMASEPATIEEIILKAKGVVLVDSLNPSRLPISALGVQLSGMGDRAARDRYFIAMARSKGIPARHEPVTGRLQYYDLLATCGVDAWRNVDFDGEAASAAAASAVPRGTLMVNYVPSKHNDDPKYYSHFTVARFRNGRYETIELSDPDADMGAAGSLSAIFRKPVVLEAGDYMLTSGTRMADGTVLSEVRFFPIEAGEQTTLDMTMREDDNAVQVIGTMNPESKFLAQGATEPQSILSTTGRGYFVLALLEAKKEPTNHALRDIAALKAELEQWGRGLVFLFPTAEQLAAFDASEFGELPKTITYGVDKGGEVAGMLRQSLELTNMNDLPVFVVADTFGRVVFVSQGYRIGLGEQMMKVIRSL